MFPISRRAKIATLFASFAVLAALVAYGYFGSRRTLDYDKRGKFLCLDIATYEQATGHLPHDIDRLSWRVELLRSDGDIKHLAIFQQFHLDEPWDSPHNKGLIEKIPWWLQDPDGERGYSCYRGVSGKNCAFDHGATVKAIPSGDPSPLAAVITKEPCPWTKPADVPVEEVVKGDCLRWFTGDFSIAKQNSEDSFTIVLGSGGDSRRWAKTKPMLDAYFRFSK